MKNLALTRLLLAAAAAASVLALSACETEDPTYAIVDNDYPAIADGGAPSTQLTVYKVWWSSSLFGAPIAAGAESEQERVVTANEFAYALLAPGWDPASTTQPSVLVPVRTATSVLATRGETLHIHISDLTVIGRCDATPSQPLAQEDADLITQRLFPGDFAAGTYDAKTCTWLPTTDAATQD